MGLAQFVIKGRSQAVLVISVFALLAFILLPLAPVFLVLSFAALALVTLRNELSTTLSVVVLSVAVCVAITWTAGVPSIGMGPVGFWFMVVLVAEVLRRSNNLALAILTGLVIVVLMVLACFILVPDPVQMWYELIIQFVQTTGLDLPGLSDQQIKLWAKLMTGGLATTGLILIVVSVLFGRWWQARLVESDGFRQEFHQLRLGRVLTVIAVGLLVLSVVTDSALLVALSAPTLVVYLFQGLAVIHAFVRQQTNSSWSIAIVYVLLILFQQLVLLISLMGIVDAWLDSRRRWLSQDAG